MTLDEFVPFGAQFSANARIFGLVEYASGNACFWYDVLQIHDTHGVPFDLIYRKLKSSARMSFQHPIRDEQLELSENEFGEFMQMTRYGAETHGIGLVSEHKTETQ